MYDYLDIHTHHTEKKTGVTAIYSVRAGENRPSEGLFCYGIHPYDVDHAQEQWLDQDYSNPRLVAIGEVGLDFRYNESAAQQVKWFEKQIQIAKENNLPIIIHTVKSLPQTLRLLSQEKIERFIIHGFRGSLDSAKQIINHSGAISLGEPLIRDQRLQEVVKEIPTEALFLESDESQIEIQELYKKLAQIKKIDLEELKQKIKTNYKRIFYAK